MGDGYSFESFPEVILKLDNQSVTTVTLYNWRKVYPSFNNAYEVGKSLKLRLLEDVAIKRAKGWATKTVKGVRIYAPDVDMIKFLLKTQYPQQYPSEKRLMLTGDQEHPIAVKSQVTLDPENVEELVEIGKRIIEVEDENR